MRKRAAAREPKRVRAGREARVSPGFLFAGGEIFTAESAEEAEIKILSMTP
jgi:hypothetical protein